MIVGIGGASASTSVAGFLSARASRESFKIGSYFCAVKDDYPASIYNLCITGWDYRFRNLTEAVKANGVWAPDRIPPDISTVPVMKAILGPTDYAVRVEGQKLTANDLPDATAQVVKQIEHFRSSCQVDRVIVANMSSPAYARTGELDEKMWHSVSAYSMAAVQTGSDWIEFTPTDSITPALLTIAEAAGARIAGRDGSTGQTILKLVLRDFFIARGLRLESWYSTNLIGNRDGLVLSHPDYSQTKIRDKRAVLNQALHDPSDHIVEIKFHRPSGDNKESWDCVHFSGFFNQIMSLRVNWHGADSYLAAPLLFDIVAGLMRAHEKKNKPGLVSELGLLFKNPLGVEMPTWEGLLTAYKQLIA